MHIIAYTQLKYAKCKIVQSCFKCCYCPFPMDHVTDGAQWRVLPVTRARHRGRQERRHTGGCSAKLPVGVTSFAIRIYDRSFTDRRGDQL